MRLRSKLSSLALVLAGVAGTLATLLPAKDAPQTASGIEHIVTTPPKPTSNTLSSTPKPTNLPSFVLEPIIDSAKDQAIALVGEDCNKQVSELQYIDYVDQIAGYSTNLTQAAQFHNQFFEFLDHECLVENYAKHQAGIYEALSILPARQRWDFVIETILAKGDIPIRIKAPTTKVLIESLREMPDHEKEEGIEQLCHDKLFLFTQPQRIVPSGNFSFTVPNYDRHRVTNYLPITCRTFLRESPDIFRRAVGYEGDNAPELLRIADRYAERSEEVDETMNSPGRPWENIKSLEKIVPLNAQLRTTAAFLVCQAYEQGKSDFPYATIIDYVKLLQGNVNEANSLVSNGSIGPSDFRMILNEAKEMCE